MTKNDIIERFKDIDFMYNDSSRLDTLSHMIDELLKSQPQIVRCKDCKHGEPGACGDGVDCDGGWHDNDWFCADGEKDGE